MKKNSVNNIMEQMDDINAILLNQYKIKCQTVFLATLDKQDEDD